jgi:hypothetical protein
VSVGHGLGYIADRGAEPEQQVVVVVRNDQRNAIPGKTFDTVDTVDLSALPEGYEWYGGV